MACFARLPIVLHAMLIDFELLRNGTTARFSAVLGMWPARIGMLHKHGIEPADSDGQCSPRTWARTHLSGRSEGFVFCGGGGGGSVRV